MFVHQVFMRNLAELLSVFFAVCSEGSTQQSAQQINELHRACAVPP